MFDDDSILQEGYDETVELLLDQHAREPNLDQLYNELIQSTPEEAKRKLRVMLVTLLKEARADCTPPGLTLEQSPEYTTDGHALIRRSDGLAIPPHEPVYVLRASSRGALAALEYAYTITGTMEHILEVGTAINAFRRYERSHASSSRALPETGSGVRDRAKGTHR